MGISFLYTHHAHRNITSTEDDVLQLHATIFLLMLNTFFIFVAGRTGNEQPQACATRKTVPQDCEDARVLMHKDESSALQDEALPTAATNSLSAEMDKGTPGGARGKETGLGATSHPNTISHSSGARRLVSHETYQELAILQSRVRELEKELEWERKQNELLSFELKKAQHKNEDLGKKCIEMHNQMLNLDNVKKGKDFLYYTGLPTYDQLHNLCDLVLARYPQLCKGNYMRAQTPMTLVRLRTGMPCKEIARNFGLSESTLSRTFSQWIFMLSEILKSITRFPRLHEIQKYMPECFRESQTLVFC